MNSRPSPDLLLPQADELQNKKFVIVGFARQGQALAQFALEAGAQVVVTDLETTEILGPRLQEFERKGVTFVLGHHPVDLLNNTDLLAVSGGVASDSLLVRAARARGIPVTNDSHEFIKRAPSAVIGITGSAGKSTTTALAGTMAQLAGRRTWVGGNIGRPLLADLHKMAADDVVVQELSSFQLEHWTHSPRIAAVLNLTPNHLDRHKTMANYVEAKANILRFQASDDVAVLAQDDPGSMELAPLVRGRLRLFSRSEPVDDGAFVEGDHVFIRQAGGAPLVVCSLEDIRLRGPHNVLNVLAAVTIADSIGITPSEAARAIRQFRGIEHRLELVRTLNGVMYVNDSIATAPERVLAALASFDEPVILLAGGRDKDMAWEAWAEQVVARVHHVILFGDLALSLETRLAAVARSSGSQPRVTRLKTMAEAILAAAGAATPGQIVLLSPGGTSFDAFRDFAERGEHFRQLVHALPPRHT